MSRPDPTCRPRALAVALAAGALVLASACGDDTAAPPEPGPEPEPTTTTETPVDDPDPAPDCDPDEALTVVDASLERARLAPGGDWTVDGEGSTFADRLADPDEFADRLALGCALRAVQSGGDGAERALLMAWTGARLVYVVHATDEPTSPYERAAVFDLLAETPRGEFVEGPEFPERVRTTWAATLDGGESFIVSADDYPIGAVAKSWQAGLELAEPEAFVSLDAERYGIDRLRDAGAGNVDVGELPELDSEIGWLQFVSPTGQVGEARVAPTGWIDPTTPWLAGPTSTDAIDGVEVFVSEAGPDDFFGIHLSFECGEWVWHVSSGYGTLAELRGFVGELVGVLEC